METPEEELWKKMLVTAALAYCPLYTIMKINTACKPK
jgi:hypothetical protein